MHGTSILDLPVINKRKCAKTDKLQFGNATRLGFDFLKICRSSFFMEAHMILFNNYCLKSR